MYAIKQQYRRSDLVVRFIVEQWLPFIFEYHLTFLRSIIPLLSFALLFLYSHSILSLITNSQFSLLLLQLALRLLYSYTTHPEYIYGTEHRV